MNPLSGPESDVEQNEGIARVVKTSAFGRCYDERSEEISTMGQGGGVADWGTIGDLI